MSVKIITNNEFKDILNNTSLLWEKNLLRKSYHKDAHMYYLFYIKSSLKMVVSIEVGETTHKVHKIAYYDYDKFYMENINKTLKNMFDNDTILLPEQL